MGKALLKIQDNTEADVTATDDVGQVEADCHPAAGSRAEPTATAENTINATGRTRGIIVWAYAVVS